MADPIIAEYSRLPTAAVSDAIDRLGIHGVAL
jgi:hypothetical protein